jgi:hypothetical protein
MSVSYLDVFLAFLGMTFGLPSVLPGLFFRRKAEPPRTSQARSTDAGATTTDDDVTAI